MTNSLKINGLLLAAGLSQRMGSQNKLLLNFNGRPMIRRVAETLLDSNLQSLYVVLGFEHDHVQAVLSDLPVNFIVNPLFEQGQATSISAGLSQIPRFDDGVLIALGDQPFLSAGDVNMLLNAFAESTTDKIIIPCKGSDRGNPIIIPKEIAGEIAAGSANVACRHFIDRNPEKVEMLQVENDAFFKDIDTPEAFQEITHSA